MIQIPLPVGISSTWESGYASISSSSLKHPVGTGTLETSANADTLATVFSLSHKVFCYQLWFMRARPVNCA